MIGVSKYLKPPVLQKLVEIKYMELRFGSMPNWLQRLLLFWGVGALVVVVLFVFVALFHILILGAVFGLCFFVVQAIYHYFVGESKNSSTLFTQFGQKKTDKATNDPKKSDGQTYEQDVS